MKRELADEETVLQSAKRQEIAEEVIEDDFVVELGDEHNPQHAATSGTGHPVGVQPEGNLLLSSEPNARSSGLGALAVFDDTFLNDSVFALQDGRDQIKLACVSRAFYAFVFSSDNELWKPLVLDLTQGDFTFQWNWRKTYEIEYQRRNLVLYPSLKNVVLMNSFVTNPSADFSNECKLEETLPPFKLRNFFSDVQFEGWYCLDAFRSNQDVWDKEYHVDRVDARTVTVQEFYEKYEKPGKPCVITNYVSGWRANETWSVDHQETAAEYKDVRFACGFVDIPLHKFLLYCRRVGPADETPLYLFDKQFVERCPAMADDYEVPPYFAEDYFALMSEHKRPPFRWLLIGPVASGSSFHKDPQYTQAFNGLIQGKKKWIMYPPHIVPPGIIPSSDHLEVHSPFSVSEWFVKYYHETQQSARKQKNAAEPGYDHVTDYPHRCAIYNEYKPVEIVQKPGEIVFVPSQWWHTAVNLDTEHPQGSGPQPAFKGAIAVTANNINRGNFLHCAKFLSKIGQETMREDLETSVEAKYPGLWDQLEQGRKAATEKLVKSHIQENSNGLLQQLGGVGVMQSAVSAVRDDLGQFFQKEEQSSGFSFGFF